MPSGSKEEVDSSLKCNTFYRISWILRKGMRNYVATIHRPSGGVLYNPFPRDSPRASRYWSHARVWFFASRNGSTMVHKSQSYCPSRVEEYLP